MERQEMEQQETDRIVRGMEREMEIGRLVDGLEKISRIVDARNFEHLQRRIGLEELKDSYGVLGALRYQIKQDIFAAARS